MDILNKLKSLFKSKPKLKMLPPPAPVRPVKIQDLKELRRIKLKTQYNAAFLAIQKTDSDLLQ